MSNELHKIKKNLVSSTLEPMWNREFYHAKDWGTSPCNCDYWIEEPLRLMYDGIYNDDGLMTEFTIGIMSNGDYGDFEMVIEDHDRGTSISQHFPSFDSALKEFIKITGITKPMVYTDDSELNAILLDYKVRPFAKVTA